MKVKKSPFSAPMNVFNKVCPICLNILPVDEEGLKCMEPGEIKCVYVCVFLNYLIETKNDKKKTARPVQNQWSNV